MIRIQSIKEEDGHIINQLDVKDMGLTFNINMMVEMIAGFQWNKIRINGQ